MKQAQALDFRDQLRKTPLALCSPVRNTIYFDLQPRLYYRCEHTSKFPLGDMQGAGVQWSQTRHQGPQHVRTKYGGISRVSYRHRGSVQPKRDREQFRSALVSIIMWV